MDVNSANQILQMYANQKHHEIGQDGEILLMEALYYLMHEKNDPAMMEWLGDIYNEKGRYDLAYKYWNKAVQAGMKAKLCSIGELWFTGKLGTPNYEKAYKCFNICIGLVGETEIEEEVLKQYRNYSKLRIADMYRDGLYLEQNYKKYKDIVEIVEENIEESFDYENESEDKITYWYEMDSHWFEALKRLGDIAQRQLEDDEPWMYQEGEENDPAKMFLEYQYSAIDCLAISIKETSEYKDKLILMQELIARLYKNVELNLEDLDEGCDLYDLYHFLDRVAKVYIVWQDKKYLVETKYKNNDLAVYFNDKWYRNLNDFFYKATLGENIPIVNLYEEIRLEEVRQ